MQSVSPDFWNSSLSEILKKLETSTTGLAQTAALKRLKIVGKNTLQIEKKTTIAHLLLRRFKNPLVILLLIICFIAFVLDQKWDCLIIIIIISLGISLDFFQEYSSNQAVKKLQESISLKTKVLRDNTINIIKNKNLVPGDIVYLKAGDMVPADGRLFWENHLFVNQAILTGESFPVEKNAFDLSTTSLVPSTINLENAVNSVFMGTSVVSGEARMVVCATGYKTYINKISEPLKEDHSPSSFEIATRKLGLLLMKITIFLVFFVLMVNFYFHRSWLETVLFSLALAVGMTPEFLPMVMSVALARGAKKMAKKHVIVKRLSAIHDLGGMNILCTDKTGTLTEAKVKLINTINANDEKSEQVHFLAYLNSFFETGLKSPLDDAILDNKTVDVSEWEKIDEIPFDFERKRISVLLDNGKHRKIIVKGAPENILSSCTHYHQHNKLKPLTPQMRLKLLDLYQRESEKGYRILAIAWQTKLKSHHKAIIEDEKDLIFSGFCLFYDPPKIDARTTITSLKKQKIDVYILTGDSKEVTMHLCHELNIPITGVLTGPEISRLDDLALSLRLRHTNLYCRLTPDQKRRIVYELKNLGNIVGFLGDGINDAPSLYSAHVGIAVNTSTDIAKEASDLILLEKNLQIIHDAVMEGRKAYSNIVKYFMLMTSSNFGNMLTMACTSFFLPFLPMLPIQILLNNLLYDTSQMAIPFDKVDHEFLLTPRKWNFKSILRFMLFMGPLSSIFDFLLFWILLNVIKVSPALFQTEWFMESLVTQILIIFVIRTRKSIFQSQPNFFLVTLAILLVCLGLAIPYSFLGTSLGFVAPPLNFFGILIGITFSYLIVAEQIKKYIIQEK
ncbi:MAG: magnesium-translocating P-type ATPase [Pseudomonadota bacterium]|jgi:Mg2+-importing ATPase|nr:magnesium-translocating P-type ATPase [Alphaproteobacteria bacterium]